MLEIIAQLNSIGCFTVLTVIVLIIELIPNAVESWGKFLNSVGLISKKQIRELDQKAELHHLQSELQHYQEATFQRENEWHQQSIHIRDSLKENQLHIAETMNDISKNLKKLQEDFLEEKIERMRWKILDFANAIRNGKISYVEQFHNVLKTYDDYEKILEERGLTNGQVEESIKFIREKYRELLHDD